MRYKLAGLLLFSALMVGCTSQAPETPRPAQPSAASAPSAARVDAALIAWLPFDGTTADAGPKHFTAKVTGTPAFQPGHKGQAASMPGKGSWVEVPVGSVDLSKGLTLECWLNPSGSKVAPGSYQFLCAYGDFGIGMDDSHTVYGRMASADGSRIMSFNEATVKPGQWSHAALVWDPATKGLRFYLNGKKLGETNDMQKPPNVDANTPLVVGAMDSQDTNPYTGLIDEVRFYARPLTEAEIQSDAR